MNNYVTRNQSPLSLITVISDFWTLNPGGKLGLHCKTGLFIKLFVWPFYGFFYIIIWVQYSCWSKLTAFKRILWGVVPVIMFVVRGLYPRRIYPWQAKAPRLVPSNLLSGTIPVFFTKISPYLGEILVVL